MDIWWREYQCLYVPSPSPSPLSPLSSRSLSSLSFLFPLSLPLLPLPIHNRIAEVSLTNDLWRYSPATDEWTLYNSKADKIMPYYKALLWITPDYVWIYGGDYDLSGHPPLFTTLFRYNVSEPPIQSVTSYAAANYPTSMLPHLLLLQTFSSLPLFSPSRLPFSPLLLFPPSLSPPSPLTT